MRFESWCPCAPLAIATAILLLPASPSAAQGPGGCSSGGGASGAGRPQLRSAGGSPALRLGSPGQPTMPTATLTALSQRNALLAAQRQQVALLTLQQQQQALLLAAAMQQQQVNQLLALQQQQIALQAAALQQQQNGQGPLVVPLKAVPAAGR